MVIRLRPPLRTSARQCCEWWVKISSTGALQRPRSAPNLAKKDAAICRLEKLVLLRAKPVAAVFNRRACRLEAGWLPARGGWLNLFPRAAMLLDSCASLGHGGNKPRWTWHTFRMLLGEFPRLPLVAPLLRRGKRDSHFRQMLILLRLENRFLLCCLSVKPILELVTVAVRNSAGHRRIARDAQC